MKQFKYYKTKYLIIITLVIILFTAVEVYAAKEVSPMTNKKNIEKTQKQDNSPNTWIQMKNYRVWEPTRKEFQYPENWLEPASTSNTNKKKLQ